MLPTARATPLAPFADVTARGYWVYPVSSLTVLDSAPGTRDPDLPSSQLNLGAAGFDCLINGGFTFDTPGHYHAHPAGAVMRRGVLDHAGVDRAASRGGVAVLMDGTIVVGRAQGQTARAIQDRFGQPGNPVRDFMGGGALLIEDGTAVSSDDLAQRQRFLQGGRGLAASQMHRTEHAVVGIRDGQAFVLIARNKAGRTIQSELLAAGFTTVVKFDGGSGAFFRSAHEPRRRLNGHNSLGFGICLRS